MTGEFTTIIIYIVGPTVVTALGVWAHRKRTAIDTGKIPMNVLAATISRQDAQMEKLLTNHLEHDRQEREEMIKSLSAIRSGEELIVTALKEVAESVKDARAEASVRSSKLHERINAMHLDIRSKGVT